MKASLKFREDQKPLLRAKIPISILGLPFYSAVSAGESNELRLDLVTAFESGPSLRASYRPNDSLNPFAFSIKSGIGSLGSPTGAPMSMTAEFNFLTGSTSPAFMVMFKPRFGDFSFRKSVVSPAVVLPAVKKVVDVDHDVDPTAAVWVESPLPPLQFGKANSAVSPASFLNRTSAMLSGVEVSARSVLPLKSSGAVRFRWGVRLPEGNVNGFNMSFKKLPMLVMNKISIEHIPAANNKVKKDESSKGFDMVEACTEVRRQLEAMKAESWDMKKAVQEIRAMASVANSGLGGKVTTHGLEGDVVRGRNILEGSGRGRVKEEDKGNQELKKALKEAAGGSGK